MFPLRASRVRRAARVDALTLTPPQNIDLHALTGWIPERISLRRSDSDADSDPEREFNKIADRFHRGDCLATVATGPISDAAAERAGLVPTHAYAMLNIRNVKVGQGRAPGEEPGHGRGVAKTGDRWGENKCQFILLLL